MKQMSEAPRATLTNGDVQVDIYWLGDRFGHTVSVIRDGQAEVEWRLAAGSVESPVFQELHEQATDSGEPILFLSGAASGAHWSMSVHSEGKEIRFDAAARIARRPIRRVIEYAGSGYPPRIVSFAPLASDTRVTCGESIVTVAADCAVEESLPTTLRWQYVVGPSD